MKYRLRNGVVLLNICDSCYLFPSRNSGVKLPVIISAPEELVSVLNDQVSILDVKEEIQKKIKRLMKNGYIEEY